MIEKANQRDLEEILSRSVDALREGSVHTFKPSQEQAEQLIRTTLGHGGYYLSLKEDDNLRGWVLIGSSKDYFSQESIGFIYELYVLPAYRGKGLSRILMKAAIDKLFNKGHGEIRLNVKANNFAKELYKEFGFIDRQISISLKV
ncbi:GNAT family N-acetyltransferase [Priestia endophytica]|uniref:GNAT family N-acetyltransferase n=1 Tax=Priestia endophytica TaxID=135735 RepID=UPI003D26AD86